MTIAIVSDVHGATRKMNALLDAMPPVDALCFLGDLEQDGEYLTYGMQEKCPRARITTVAGNNDPFSRLPGTVVEDFGGVRVMITHGHLFRGVRLHRRTLAARAQALGCALALYGHTHAAKDESIGGVRLINPGALMQGEWALLDIGPEGDVTLRPQRS